MSKWNKGLMAAMESEKEPQVIRPSISRECNDEILKLQNYSREMMSFSDCLQDAVDSAVSLENIARSFDGSKAKNQAYKIAQKSVHYNMKRAGFDIQSVPSLESFEKQVATEGILDTVEKIWKSIIQAIKNVYKWISEFFKSIFSADKKLSDNSKEILKTVENIEKKNGGKVVSVPVSKTIHGNFVKQLTMDGKFDVTNLIVNLKHLSDKVVSTNQCLLATIAIIKPLAFKKGQPINFPDIEAKVGESFKFLPDNKQILGSRMLIVEGSGDNPLKVTIGPFNGTPYKDLEEAQVANTQQIKQIIEECDNMSVVIQNGKTIEENLNHFYKKLQEDISKFSKEDPSNPDLPKLVKLLTNINVSVVTVSKCMFQTAVMINHAAHEYCKECLTIDV